MPSGCGARSTPRSARRTSPTCWWKPACPSERVTAWWDGWCARRSAPACRSIACPVRWRRESILHSRWRCRSWERGRTRSRAAQPPGGRRAARWRSSWRHCGLHSPRVEGLNPRSCLALAGKVAYVAVWLQAVSETAAFHRGSPLRCLALNASFEPLTMVPVRRALRLVIDRKAEIVEAEGPVVKSERLAIPRPAVIRLVKFVHVPRRFRRQVTNTFLFARDNYRCQFCGRSQQELRHRECLTRDHLVPLSRGGTNGWSNVLTACSSCNTRKGNLLPEEAGMHPLRPPFEPHFVHLAWAVRRLTCVESDHGSRCDICMGEATRAMRLASQGSSLDDVRRAIDQRFGS